MAKKNTQVETVEDQEAPQGVRPNDLAKELGVDGKRIRAFLRKEFPRTEEEHNTNWALTDAQIEAVLNRFSPDEDSDEDE